MNSGLGLRNEAAVGTSRGLGAVLEAFGGGVPLHHDLGHLHGVQVLQLVSGKNRRKQENAVILTPSRESFLPLSGPLLAFKLAVFVSSQDI